MCNNQVNLEQLPFPQQILHLPVDEMGILLIDFALRSASSCASH
jgi:hypothetical protein